jgi:hypothetical protein
VRWQCVGSGSNTLGEELRVERSATRRRLVIRNMGRTIAARMSTTGKVTQIQMRYSSSSWFAAKCLASTRLRQRIPEASTRISETWGRAQIYFRKEGTGRRPRTGTKNFTPAIRGDWVSCLLWDDYHFLRPLASWNCFKYCKKPSKSVREFIVQSANLESAFRSRRLDSEA